MIAREQLDEQEIDAELPHPPPDRALVQGAIARYARLARRTQGVDEGDVAGALRAEIDALAPARTSATRRLLGEE